VTSVLRVDGLLKRFGDFTAVDGIGFDVEQGTFLTLLGPSGCGKTTTLRMIGGFEQPNAGQILLDGRDIVHLPPYERDVNTVFQNYALFPHMTVFENVAFGLEAKHLPRPQIRSRVAEVLDMVRLGHFRDRSVRGLSGGEQQRVALARAFALRPAVLLLDEPLGALDLKLRREMQLELKSLQRALGIAFIYVTHDQEEALSMSDRIIVINRGRIEQEGAPEEIYARPGSAFTANFLGDANVLQGTVVGLDAKRLRIRFAYGEGLVAAGDAQPAAGTPVLIAVRTESVLLGPAATGVECRFAARVAAVAFYGAFREYALELEGGMALRARLVAQGAPRVGVGETVPVGWRAENAVMVSA
jgi:spermidine/putrescine transport system ATP-binding protein